MIHPIDFDRCVFVTHVSFARVDKKLCNANEILNVNIAEMSMENMTYRLT